MLLFVPPDSQQDVREEFENLIHVPFRIEFSGSHILFVDRQEDYADLDRMRSRQTIDRFRELSEDPEEPSGVVEDRGRSEDGDE